MREFLVKEKPFRIPSIWDYGSDLVWRLKHFKITFALDCLQNYFEKLIWMKKH